MLCRERITTIKTAATTITTITATGYPCNGRPDRASASVAVMGIAAKISWGDINMKVRINELANNAMEITEHIHAQ
jgi:hypothetical protein